MTLWRDTRFALRQLRKSPGFTATVLLTLGLCIGANTAIFSVVDSVFFRALPYPDPGRLVVIAGVYRTGGLQDVETGKTGREWELIRDHATFLDSAVQRGADGVNLFAQGRAEYIQQQRVSAGFFHVLGILPLAGREFTRQEDVPGGPPLAILSYELWHHLFGGDRSILGRTIELRGEPYIVIGVMPQGFRTDAPADLWTPLRPSTSGEGSGSNYTIIGRVKSNASFAQANGQLNSIFQASIAERHLPPGLSVQEQALPLQAGTAVDLRERVNLLWGAVALVLLIGCVNIAGILLARSAVRSREIATRLAIGASRARVITQLLVESVLLALGGGLVGLAIGPFALRGLLALRPKTYETWGPVQMDLRVVCVMVLASLATGMLFGLFPALDATSVDLRSALAEGGRGSSGGRKLWRRQALVFAEVALGVALVAGAGLLIRTFRHLANQPPGFNGNNVMSASLSLQDARYKTTSSGIHLFRESLDRMRQIPGVESAAVALSLPYERPLNLNVSAISGRNVPLEKSLVNFNYVTPDYFNTLQMPLLRGRLFESHDGASSARVAVVNRAFVRKFLASTKDPLGVDVNIENLHCQIVGIVADTQEQNGWGGQYGPLNNFAEIYLPVAQLPDDLFAGVHIYLSPNWIVRTRGPVNGLPDKMRRALAAVDPRLPFSGFQSMPEIRGASLADQRYQAILFGSLAFLALLLSAVGIYGLVAQMVTQRTREMGIRLALGATVKSVVRAAAVPGMKVALFGVAAGLVLSFFATRLLASMVWGISTTDPLTLAAVAVLLVVIVAIASLIPTLRLLRLDPAQTLRSE